MRIFVCLSTVFLLILSCSDQVNEKNKSKRDSSHTKKDSLLPQKPEVIRNVLDSTDTTHYVYLTFDDGPHYTTPPLTQLLSRKNIKSSFFVVGSQITYSAVYDSTFRTVKNNPLFKIYNHTVTHAITRGRYGRYYRHPDTVWHDILNNKRHLPDGAHITRLPGTNAHRIGAFRYITNDAGKRVIAHLDSMRSNEALFGWDLIWAENESKDSLAVEKMIQAVVNDVKNKRKYHQHTIILFHDFYFNTPKSLEYLSHFIDELQNKYHCVFRWAEEFPDINS